MKYASIVTTAVCAVVFLLNPVLMLAKKAPIEDVSFTVYSVSIQGDSCDLALKDGEVTYFTHGWAYACEGLRSGDSAAGHIVVDKVWGMATLKYIYVYAGANAKGRITYRPFLIDLQSQ